MNIKQLKFKSDNHLEYRHLLTRVGSTDIRHRFELLSSSLKITEEITPSIFGIVSSIEQKLQVSNLSIEYYIKNSADINASCFSLNSDIHLIMVLTSGLINIMNDDELSFVIGHEIGHYLFGHLQYTKTTENHNLTRYYQANEISADRIGLVCSGNIQSAIKAIVKTISGLGDKFISDKLYTFIHQHNELDTQKSYLFNSTHPTLPTRAKALILFSMSELYYNWINKKEKAPIDIEKLESTIEGYLYDTSLKAIKAENNQILSRLKMWLIVKIFIDSDRFEEFEFDILKKEIGYEKTDKVIKYVQSHSIKDIDDKINEVLIEYQSLSQKDKKSFIRLLESIFTPLEDRYKYKIAIKTLLKK
jgi:hypothetical protein